MKDFRALCLAGAVALLGCSKAGQGTLPDLSLPTFSGGKSGSLSSCPTDKCLTVYLAPWCGYCRAATPALLALQPFLKKRQVEMRVIIGLDQPDRLLEYARVFGPDALLDLNESLPLSGVPHFYVSDPKGSILKEFAGYPSGAETPQDLASFLGLL